MKLFSFLTLVLCVLTTPAWSQELKLATLAPDGSVWMEELRKAAAHVEEETGGDVRVRFYPGGVMGDAEAVLRRMRLGQLHGGAFTLGDLATQVPETNVFWLPFLFRETSEFLALRDAFQQRIESRFEEEGLVMAGIAVGGFAYFFSRDPIERPDRFGSGFRIWIPSNDPLGRQTLESLGASPVPLAMSEVYTALQTGTVNTFASTPAGAIILQWHTRARYMLDQPLVMTAGTMVFDRRYFERLEKSHQDIVNARFRDAMAALEQRNLSDDKNAREALKAQNIELIEPEPEWSRAWEQAALEARQRLQADGTLELPWLEEVESRLEELRK